MHKIRFKIILMLVAATTLVCSATPAVALATPVSDGKVAVVNGFVISRADFEREMSRTYSQYAKSGRPLNELQLKDLAEVVLERLINRELLYQASQKNGIKIENDILINQMSALKKQFNNENQFKSALEKMNISEAALKSQMKKGLAIQNLIDKRFIQTTSVSDKEVKAYYDNNPKSFTQPEKVQARHILIKVDSQADESEKVAARKKLKEVQSRLQKGEDFGELAKEYSEGPSGARGGDLGYFQRGQMVKPFEESAFVLKPGQVSDVVETRFGYHLIEVTDRKPEKTENYEDVKENLHQMLKQQKVQQQVARYIEKLKGLATVERFLPEFPQ